MCLVESDDEESDVNGLTDALKETAIETKAEEVTTTTTTSVVETTKTTFVEEQKVRMYSG